MFKLLGRGPPNLIGTLSKLRTIAFRKGIYFQALTTQERLLTDLIRNYVKIVNNATLATVLARIIGKLIYSIKNSFSNMIERVGQPIAELWSQAATKMGWKEASSWVDDRNILSWFGLCAYYSGKRD